MGRSAKVGGKNIDRARKLVEARPYHLEEAAEAASQGALREIR